MPVPVRTSPKQPAHPVNKRHSGRTPQPLTKTLGASNLGHPPSFGTREEWINSLPTWRRTKPRRIFEEDENIPAGQGFPSGLVDAADASAIKGASAEARHPPLANLFHSLSDSDARPAMHREPQPLLETRRAHSFMDETALDMDIDQPGFGRHSDPGETYQKGAFSPVYEEPSPEIEVASSPIEPVTPFGVFVDRAVATSSNACATINSEWNDTTGQRASQLHEDSQLTDIPAEPKEPVPAPEVVTPSASPEYRKLASCFSEWIATFVWKVCTKGMALPEPYTHPGPSFVHHSDAPPSYLAGAVHSLLLSTLLEPSAILLALWYIARLPVCFDAAPIPADQIREAIFRSELLGDNVGYERDTLETTAPFRLIVLGFMLSNKWLSDHTYSNKTWHTVSNVPIAYLNKLESLALDIFAYDLSVSNTNWSKWLTFVMSYHMLLISPSFPQPISRPSSNPHTIIRRAIDDIIVAIDHRYADSAGPQPFFMGLEDRRKERAEQELAARDVYEIDLDEDGPLREEYLPKRRVSNASSYHRENVHDSIDAHRQSASVDAKLLPPPAKWSPAGDEPILRDSHRINGHAVPTNVAPSYGQYPRYEQNAEVCSGQNWSMGGYVPMKHIPISAYPLDGYHPHPPAYNHIPLVQSLAMSHSRSNSLSYGQDNISSHTHQRSLSQTRFEGRCGAQMTATQPTSYPDPLWGIARHFLAPAFAPPCNVAYQSSWLRA